MYKLLLLAVGIGVGYCASKFMKSHKNDETQDSPQEQTSMA